MDTETVRQILKRVTGKLALLYGMPGKPQSLQIDTPSIEGIHTLVFSKRREKSANATDHSRPSTWLGTVSLSNRKARDMQERHDG